MDASASDLPGIVGERCTRQVAPHLLLALIAGLFAFGGWHMVTYTAEETRHPERTIPRALAIGKGEAEIAAVSDLGEKPSGTIRITAIDHVGIAVPDLDGAAALEQRLEPTRRLVGLGRAARTDAAAAIVRDVLPGCGVVEGSTYIKLPSCSGHTNP